MAERVRQLVRSFLAKNQPESAVYWSEKAVSLSEGEPQDVYWFAHSLHISGQHHRAAHVLKNTNLVERYAAARCLAAKCYYSCGAYEEAQEMIGVQVPGAGTCPKPVAMDETHPDIPSDNIESSILLLKGKVYEALGNRDLAQDCFRQALQADVYCCEALTCLVSHHMLSAAEEDHLLKSLPFDSQCSKEEKEMVKFLYGNKLKKYDKPGPTPGPVSIPQLNNNPDTLVCHAERHFYNCHTSKAYSITSKILKADPFNESCLPLHISLLVELKKANELFYLAHQLVDNYPRKALSWFAVGCYYLLIEKSEAARRLLIKATTLDRAFGPAWLAFGHSFAVENEHDQAMAAYFTASQIMKGCHLPALYIGLEYGLTNDTKLAERFFNQALEIAPEDPFVLHEMGVVAYHSLDNYGAERLYRKALKIIQSTGDECIAEQWEPLLNNLGHCCRRLMHYDEALSFHQQALTLSPYNPSTYSAIGFVHALAGRFQLAIDYFHKALGLRREDTFSTTMLSHAMEQVFVIDALSGEPEPPSRPFEGSTKKLRKAMDTDGDASSAGRSMALDESSALGDNLHCNSELNDSSVLGDMSMENNASDMVIDSDLE